MLQFILTNYADRTISQLYYSNHQRSQTVSQHLEEKHSFQQL